MQHGCRRRPHALTLAASMLLAGTACQPRTMVPPQGRTPEPVVRDTIVWRRPAEPLPERTPRVPPAPLEPTPLVPAYRETTVAIALPQVEREFRGVWVATVGNMDWPSSRNLTTAQAQRELIRILDAARDMGLNTVIFQVRPMADAFYASSIEPWSDYLTGESGRAPEPFWDPLEFAIRQAHARGLELHAWFNPFRAGFVTKKSPMSANHVTRRRPDLVRRYGSFLWLDPAEPDARRQALDVISDVVRRYDIDAVHIDDYFYPYQERDARGRLIHFPDDATWQRYGAGTGMSRADWRRSNVDRFVEQMYHTVRSIKPHVRVGISPFGIWRSGYPAGVRGLDAYTELFADSRKWLTSGWADYYAPQLYWKPYAPEQDYTTLLQWWAEQNRHGRLLVAGNIPNSIGNGARGWRASEILEQVRLTRANNGASGNIHFSASALLRNPDGLNDAFRAGVYRTPALMPASPWLSSGRLPRPLVQVALNESLLGTAIQLPGEVERPGTWIVHARWGNEWRSILLPGTTREYHVEWHHGTPPDAIAVSAVDRAGVEGEPALFLLEGMTARGNAGTR